MLSLPTCGVGCIEGGASTALQLQAVCYAVVHSSELYLLREVVVEALLSFFHSFAP